MLIIDESRIETKAPVASQFIETIHGLATIRAYGWASAFYRRNVGRVDVSQKPFYLLICVQRWLLLVLGLIVAALSVLLVGLAIPLRERLDPAFVGLAVIQIMTLSESLNDLVVQWTELETCLGAISRISRFTKETTSEELQSITDSVVGAGGGDWFPTGSIALENVSATYE